MGWTATGLAALGCAALWAIALIARRTRDPLKPNLIPDRLLEMIALGCLVVLAIHALNLAGIKTGQGRPGP